MRYRREDVNGDYSFGRGDAAFLIDSPACVAQAINTRLQLWYGQWFLDTREGMPWIQPMATRPQGTAMELALRQRLLATPGVQSLLAFDATFNPSSRRLSIAATVETLYGTTTITSEV